MFRRLRIYGGLHDASSPLLPSRNTCTRFAVWLVSRSRIMKITVTISRTLIMTLPLPPSRESDYRRECSKIWFAEFATIAARSTPGTVFGASDNISICMQICAVNLSLPNPTIHPTILLSKCVLLAEELRPATTNRHRFNDMAYAWASRRVPSLMRACV